MEEIRQALAVVFVLGLLGGTLYWLRRKGIPIKGIGRTTNRRMQSLERLPLTPQHSLHLVRVDGRTLLIAVAPSGCSVLDGSGWEAPPEAGGNR